MTPERSIAAILVAAGLLLIACGDGPSPAGTVTSDDGKAVLTLPAGALPDGLTPGDISITRIDPAADEDFLVKYRLEPDGTMLAKPATLTIDTFDELWAGGPIVHEGEAGIELLEATLLRDDVFGTLRGAEVSLSHFSDLSLPGQSYLDEGVVIQPLLSTTPGNTTSAVIRVSRNASGNNYPYRWSDQFEWAPKATWTAGNLRMEEIVTNYPPADVDYVDFQQMWTCIDLGLIRVTLIVQGEYTMYLAGGSGIEYPNATDSSGGGSSNLCLEQDVVDDSITSISTMPATAPGTDVDIRGSAGAADLFNAADAAMHFDNTTYECGTSTAEMTVVCPSNVQPMGAGEVFLYGMKLQAPAASDAGYRYIYSVVVDSDGATANNWQPQGPYDWDLFQGADRWYQLERALDGSWSIRVSQVDNNQNINTVDQSTVRAVIQGDSITFFISAREMSVAAPGYRLTSFKDRGAFDFADLAADVSGTDPTEPLEITIRPNQ